MRGEEEQSTNDRLYPAAIIGVGATAIAQVDCQLQHPCGTEHQQRHPEADARP